jgi:hypothetical protein
MELFSKHRTHTSASIKAQIKIRPIYFISLLFILAVTQLEAQVSTNSSPSDQLQQFTAQLQNSPERGVNGLKPRRNCSARM